MNTKISLIILILLITRISTASSSSDIPKSSIENKNINAIKIMIKDGANVNAKGSEGRTPLIFAAKYNPPEIAKLLIKNGADINAKTKKGLNFFIVISAKISLVCFCLAVLPVENKSPVLNTKVMRIF